MEQVYDVLRVSRYDFTDEATGKQVRGVKITATTGDMDPGQDVLGVEISSITAPYEAMAQFSGPVPGKYMIEFSVGMGAKNKPALRFKSARPYTAPGK